MVNWIPQDVVAATIGGVIIAISTSLNLLCFGRVTGLSGSFYSILKADRANGFDYKAVFMIGLITIPAVLNQICGNVIESGGRTYRMFDENDANRQHIAAWIIGGVLVGFGTKMGNGCTSGHGVCGIPRFAPRSLVATCTFMATAFALATLRYSKPFLVDGPSFGPNYAPVWKWVALASLILLNVAAFTAIFMIKEKR